MTLIHMLGTYCSVPQMNHVDLELDQTFSDPDSTHEKMRIRIQTLRKYAW